MDMKNGIACLGVASLLALTAGAEEIAYTCRDGRGESFHLSLKRTDAVAVRSVIVPIEPGKAMEISADAEFRAADGKPTYNDCMIVASWVDVRAKVRHGGGDINVPDRAASWKFCQRDYVRFSDRVDGGVTYRAFSDTFNVPTNAIALELECFVKSRDCEVDFRSVRARAVPALPKRIARIVLANPRKAGKTITERVALVEKALEEAFAKVERPDLVMACSEVFSTSGNPDPKDKWERVPEGPTSQLLIRYAKKYHCYMAGGVCEREANGVEYNSAVLFDREGRLVGKYHKVHLTTGEFLGGKLAGDSYSVFETDFGRIGFCICWDNFFPETMRQLQLNGAELVIFPIAATSSNRLENVFRTRALDTGMPLAVQFRQSNLPNRIIGGDGSTLAEAFRVNEPCWADIDLAYRWRVWWLSVGAAYGDPYQLYDAERNPATYRNR